ncbi:hypothetical protein SS1G_01792 [Sclerotinia sclerotiorum 1980 UF-70]|uniref:Uncharacterized protein n=1 Tax=Sclerotinia sclerotiorum (strain ATCC 18683 / 1980 / Ss-1) TaxID=665079 RepID=A7E914_SCLS1|nr:hypothetical protein SS1G_01792 [Sclerotinia sclerotiorum 1980 UF-70]EDN96866.1 hypothetical protein SS1G_01792 [Sclerotinia sclerotiorum 1980 UF-70]
MSNFQKNSQVPDETTNNFNSLSTPPIFSSDHSFQFESDIMEPLAIVGLSFEFPEDATSPKAFWKMMAEKRNAMTEIPKDRVNIDAFYHPDKARVDTDLATFDAPFFSISPAEAASMDPQQRLMLEVSYGALENAGIPLDSINGSKTAVFSASFCDDFRIMSLKDPERLSKHAASGNTFSILANRISWAYNLRGPSMHVDTACSSSLVALHLACQSLRSKESSMAIVGGSNIISSVEQLLLLSNLNLVSPDSKSYSFDSRANGYGRGEGCGVIVVKRLSDAIAHGDTIRAVIRATGTNQDGRTSSLTTPCQDAQEALIRDTYESAGLEFHSTTFFEAHGTGTAVGDPIEALAIGRVLGEGRSSTNPIYVGALKSNIGHLEGASGIAGLIKTILALEKGVIPPNANFEKLNPKIDAKKLNLAFPQECIPWPVDGLRRASINSFGLGGSNAHVVLDDAYNFMTMRGISGNHQTAGFRPAIDSIISPTLPGMLSPHIGQWDDIASIRESNPEGSVKWESGSSQIIIRPASNTDIPKLLIWSTSDEKGMEKMSRDFAEHFSDIRDETPKNSSYMADLAYTLAVRRSSLSWKSFSVSSSVLTLRNLKYTISKPVRCRKEQGLGFVFTGQGAQYAKMGHELMAYPVFHESLKVFESHLSNIGCKWSLLEELLKDDEASKINNSELSQTICTAMQVAIVDLLHSFGIFPATVIGHSSGEIAAAYASGALSMLSACKVAYFRGKLAEGLAHDTSRHGAMLAAGLSETQAMAYIDSLLRDCPSVHVVVACINSPKSVTISGDEAGISKLKQKLDAEGVFNRKLKVPVAYHSSHMNQISERYLSMIDGLESNKNSLRAAMISSVTGCEVQSDQLKKASYWVQNMVSPVRFSEALIKAVTCSGFFKNSIHFGQRKKRKLFDLLEIGPHSALQGPIKDTLATIANGKEVSYGSVLKRKLDGITTLLNAVGSLTCLGYPVDIEKVNMADQRSQPKVLADLPSYPFDHSTRHWHESDLGKNYKLRKQPRLDLLGTEIVGSNAQGMKWRKITRVSETPWIQDHVVNESTIYPAAGMLVMAIEAAKQIASPGESVKGYLIKNASFLAPLRVASDDHGVESVFHITPLEDKFDKTSLFAEFTLSTLQNERWEENCHGMIQVQYESLKESLNPTSSSKASVVRDAVEAGVTRCNQTIEADQIYKKFDATGLKFGSTFQSLDKISTGPNLEACADVEAFRWTAVDDSNHRQDHIIHPITLDAMLQTILVSLAQEHKDKLPTAVPTHVASVWIAGTGVSYPKTDTIRVYGKIDEDIPRGNISTVYAADCDTGEGMVAISGLETTFVDSGSNKDEIIKQQKLCYNIDWKPDIDLLDQAMAREYCRKGVPIKDLSQFYEDMSLLLTHFSLEIQAKVDSTELDGTRPHYQRYVQWMNEYTASLGLPANQQYDPQGSTGPAELEAIDLIMNSVENANAEGEIFVEVGRNIVNVLKGNVDPLEILFQTDLASRYYQEVNIRVETTLARVVELIAYKRPGLKVLEIGAGTGSTTDHILRSALIRGADNEATSAISEYDFTDISPSFFEAARQKFENEEPRFQFLLLDASIDPEEQGCEVGRYDLVIAANVLHATEQLDITVRNVRKLLKKNGKLVLIEITGNSWAPQFVFGTLPGWWLSTDEYRSSGPCISSDEWNNVLRRNGFSGTDVVVNDCDEPQSQVCSVVVSTAIEDITTSMLPETVIVVEDGDANTAITKELVNRLGSSGYRTTGVFQLSELANHDLTNKFCICLAELGSSLIGSLDESTFYALRSLLTTCNGMLWAKKDCQSDSEAKFNMIDGLARVLRTEYSDQKFVTLALENNTSPETVTRNIFRVFEKVISTKVCDLDLEYRENGNQIVINRAIAADYLNAHAQKFSEQQHTVSQTIGKSPPLRLDMSNALQASIFIEDEKETQIGFKEVEIQVKAIALDPYDCQRVVKMGSVGFIAGYAGIVTKSGEESDLQIGEEVYGIGTGDISTFKRSDSRLFSRIPVGQSFADAAGISLPFSVAYYAMIGLAGLRRNQTVLIHSAADAIGQAALQIAQYMGAVAFVTVDSIEKKMLLLKAYNVPENCIFDSRETSFADHILKITGSGVDVVLNSLPDSGQLASAECTKPFGHFVQMQQHELRISKVITGRKLSVHSQDMALVARAHPEQIRRSLEAISLLVRGDIVTPASPLKTRPVSEIVDELRELNSEKQVGQTVITVSQDDYVESLLTTNPDYQFDENATYMIAGGFGGLARSLARWMAGRGAKNLLLLSRSGPRIGPAQELIKDLQSQGVRIECPKCDDSTFEQMSYDQWCTTIQPRVQGSWNLHSLLPKGMEFFILLSSITGVVGTGGQANYAAGNTFMDALARARLAAGEKAVSLDLGWIESAGTVAENKDVEKGLDSAGFLIPISQVSLCGILDYYCNPARNINELNCQTVVGVATPGYANTKGKDFPQILKRSLWRALTIGGSQDSSPSGLATANKQLDYAELLSKAKSLPEAVGIVEAGLLKKLSGALGIPVDSIDTTRPIHVYGVDSLLAVSLRGWFKKEFRSNISVFDIIGNSSLDTVSGMAASRSQWFRGPVEGVTM